MRSLNYIKKTKTINMIITDEFVIVKTQAGLCNRLYVLLSYLKLAQSLNKKLKIHWQPDKFCNGFFLDYFKPIPDVVFERTNPTNNIFGDGLFSTHPDYADLYALDWNKLIVNDILTQQIEKRIEQLGANYIAVHISRTDAIRDAIRKGLYTDDNQYIDFIKKNSKNHNLYIATDNTQTVIKFNQIFKSIVKCKSPNMNVNQVRQTSLDDAIIDIFVCAKANKFMGTKCSSFSQVIECLRLV